MAERGGRSVAVAAARAGISRASGYRLLKEGRREGAHEEWRRRSLDGRHYVYMWADGIYLQERNEEDR